MLKKVGFQLTILAKAVIEIDLYIDPDFENYNLTPQLEKRIILPNETKIPP